MKRVALLMAGALLLFAVGATADGPETGVVSGTVVDDSGAPIPGVLLTLSGGTGELTALTDADGGYRFALVRPGNYTLNTSLEGFLPQEAAVAVSAGGRHEAGFTLSLGTSEEITVTSEAPMVDKFNTTVGGNVTAETVLGVAPVNRGIYGAINVLPGVTNDEESLDLSSSRPSFNGTPWQESAVFIDGVDTTYTRYGGTRMFIPVSATTSIDLTANSAGTEYGRSIGGITNVIVKSGTNRFRGDVSSVYQRLDWDANYDPHPELEQNPTRPRPADFFVLSDDERDVGDVNWEGSFGGPIKRDRAWFFLAYGDYGTFTRDRTLDGTLIDQSTDVESFIGKLNLQPADAHSLAASWMSTPTSRLFQLDNFADPYVPTFFDLGGSLVSGSWNWSVSSSFFLEAKLAYQESNEDRRLNPCNCYDPDENFAIKAADPNFTPDPALGIHAPVNNSSIYIDGVEGTWHNGWLLDNGFGTNKYPRDQFNVGLTQFAGANHELRYGIDYQKTGWDQDLTRVPLYTAAGQAFDYRAPFGYPNALNATVIRVDYNPPGLTRGASTATGENTGIYLRDRFTVGEHWTFNAGLRYENQVHENDIGREVIDSQSVAPRANLVYDVSGNGKMLFTGSAGRYYTHVNQELINENLLDGWNGTNAQDNYILCRPLLFAIGFPTPFGNCRAAGLNQFLKISEVRPASMWRLLDEGIIDVDIEPYYRDEVVLGWEWQFSDNWATKIRGIAWETANQISAGQSQLGPNGQVFEFTENVRDLPGILRDYGWIDEFVAQGYGTREQAETALAGFDDAKREYQALHIELNRRWKNGWTWLNNVVFAQSEGNTFGTSFNNTVNEFGSELHVLVQPADIEECIRLNNEVRSVPGDCSSLESVLGLPVTTANRFGDAERERPVVFKSLGYKTWELGRHAFTFGGQFQYQDGVGWHIQQGSIGGELPSGDDADTATLLVESYGTRRISGYSFLNLSAAWGFPLFGENDGELRLEVTNVTDGQDQVGVSNTPGRPQQSKRAWAQPRKVRLLATFRF